MLYFLRLVLMGVHFVLAAVVNFAIVFVRPFNPDNTRLCGRVYSLPALRILGLQVEVDTTALAGQANPFVLVANHQSNYDLFVFGAVVPRRTVSIGKTSLKWLPLFGQIYWLAGNILIDRGNPAKAKAAMLKTTEVMQCEDTSIWVFPEGTRNLGKGLLPFKKGAFQTAIAAGVPIVPLCCSSYKRTMHLNRWQAGRVKIRALPPISTRGLTADDVPALMAQCRDAMHGCIDALDAQVAAAGREQ
ncbi:MAG: 1-acyl-sn-glycerol-3-phosphate acyltransferase [Burkholderiales bacterium PBB4]|nr:MAG: 1-acyl-sn-glycerol-3-phosphate acyltransferase [Burkholderiales bacterium PBB4]